jgi:hypothetical protein
MIAYERIQPYRTHIALPYTASWTNPDLQACEHAIVARKVTKRIKKKAKKLFSKLRAHTLIYSKNNVRYRENPANWAPFLFAQLRIFRQREA